jgi:p-aminobenzoyl-glutamate transporter AbgT
MLNLQWKPVLKYFLITALVIVIAVVVYFCVNKYIQKKEGFDTNNELKEEFDYVKSFINNLVTLNPTGISSGPNAM